MRIVRGAVARARATGRVIKQGPSALSQLDGYHSWLFELYRAGVRISVDAREVALFLGLSETHLTEGLRFAERARAVESHRLFPTFYDTESLTLAMLYALVRQREPALVFETGVANGSSTRAVLEAIRTNGRGTLVSFDVDERAAESVGHELGRESWEFVHLMPPVATQLRDFAENHRGNIDLWYHDSDHRYHWQLEEFKLAQGCLAPAGILVADDIDGNRAFADYVSQHSAGDSIALFDSRKVTGFAMMSPIIRSRQPKH